MANLDRPRAPRSVWASRLELRPELRTKTKIILPPFIGFNYVCDSRPRLGGSRALRSGKSKIGTRFIPSA